MKHVVVTVLFKVLLLVHFASHILCLESSINTHSRRRFLIDVSYCGLFVGVSCPSHAIDGFDPPQSSFKVDTDTILSLVYNDVLGKGAFKTVYLVSSSTANNNPRTLRYALAVERLKGKRDSKEAIQGNRIVETLKDKYNITYRDGSPMFEQVFNWWVQPSAPNEYDLGRPVFSDSTSPSPPIALLEQKQKVPSKFLGSLWLISLKPVYDMDLQRFSRMVPTISLTERRGGSGGGETIFAGISLNDNGALELIRDLCQVGNSMNQIGLVHRDIKPKNVMLSKGRPVIIDFGFASILEGPERKSGRYCKVEPGLIKGELDYVLAKDVAKYQGCQEGDMYAMAKTMYQVLFDPTVTDEQHHQSSGRQTITETKAREKNEDFWALINDDASFAQSRFRLSQSTCSVLISIIRGLANNTMSFAYAEQMLNNELILKSSSYILVSN